MKYPSSLTKFLAASMFIAMPYFLGCESNSKDEDENKSDNHQTNNVPDDGTNIINEAFGITYPSSGSILSTRSIKISGTGIDSSKVSSLKTRVYYQDTWHNAPGSLKIYSDGQWTFGNIYLGGSSNHTIEATLKRKDNSTEQATVENIIVQ